jgi:hypothetical protein
MRTCGRKKVSQPPLGAIPLVFHPLFQVVFPPRVFFVNPCNYFVGEPIGVKQT